MDLAIYCRGQFPNSHFLFPCKFRHASANDNAKMISPKFKRLKTLNTTDDDRSRPIATDTTTTTSATAVPYLPDNVIEHILSFSPIKLAARATAVSKLWASLWPSFPVIDFDEGDPFDSDDPGKFRRFLRFLENCMQRCQNQWSLDKLRLRVVHSLAGDDKDTIDKCVTFALERFVKELELCFVGAENEVGFYQVPQAVFSSHFLVSLNLEKVKIDFISRDRVNDPLTLLSLRTMSLKEVEIDEIDLEILLKGKYVPRLEHLELNLCDLGDQADEPRSLRIWDSSLKSLEIINCHQYVFEVVECVNLETFKFISDCSCAGHGVLIVWQCDNLKHLYIYSVGLKHFRLLGCPTSMESAIFTPSLVYFLFSGVVETKVHFLESPPGLIDAEFRIQNYRWTSEYYSLLRECLEIFDCTGKLEIEIRDAKGIIIPENCRREWSPPLPRVKQLQLTFLPLPDGDYQLDDLDPSLTWIAPSAEILPHRYNSSVGQL